MLKIILVVGMLLFNLVEVEAHEKEMVALDELVRKFEANPADAQNTIQLLKELKNQGKPNSDVVERYFKTQSETDYLKEYNWSIIRDFVDDVDAPQIKYLFKNQLKFIQSYSKDDVFQKLDNVLVGHLERFYDKDKIQYRNYLESLKKSGYEHYDVVADYFYIRELRSERKSEDYFYKARKLFRYFPENRKMIKEITDGALEIMNDVSRLKVIQLWAGKTVESAKDFDAIYNYALISQKCGFKDVAEKYARLANAIAEKSKNQNFQEKARKLMQVVR
ncbi:MULTISPECIES: hypothetical protein [Porphyromonadaceae]|uniref:Tetratricopeptide repeat protein n=1 Tax=Sanguibacteroides justesenii TaxID=1547597 RepID=A0A0C3R9N2_9PORP|nr:MULTISPECIES: hypothetical protein [Porphyromonadaceae]KIO42674.1 hypothetical protein IE90_14360 [Sanguibacteroides justesenii]KIO47390.1 hypothetical protein BA92_01045 [Sanguibacteroides justesenii]MCR9013182.1 hypothetical protein [Gabonibacter chumensis]PXZ42683.1 hypothetical protein DMB45_14375 [Sanguibacteroides justesenii]